MKKLILVSMFLILLVSCKEESKSALPDNNEGFIEIVEENIDSVGEQDKAVKKSISEIKAELEAKGYKLSDHVDKNTQDTILMQQYFMVFIKTGPIRGQNEEEEVELQNAHLAHLSRMHELGYADISGSFTDHGEVQGVTIYNVPTLKMADSLANLDPMVQAGRLEIEIHPWWASKGLYLK